MPSCRTGLRVHGHGMMRADNACLEPDDSLSADTRPRRQGPACPRQVQTGTGRSLIDFHEAGSGAAIVGPILIAINHGHDLLAGEVSGPSLLRMALTVLVPYCVSTFSSVQATSKTRLDRFATPKIAGATLLQNTSASISGAVRQARGTLASAGMLERAVEGPRLGFGPHADAEQSI